MATASLGRPRDPGLDDRVFAAALTLYGQRGWSGFSIEAVARSARVGKASIYLRWSSKVDLLDEALKSVTTDFGGIDTGTVRNDLVELALLNYQSNIGPHADALIRLLGEARHIPELAERWDELRTGQVLAARSIVRRAIRRGELEAGTSVPLLLDAIIGGTFMHTLTAPPEARERVRASGRQYVESLVDLVILGSRHP